MRYEGKKVLVVGLGVSGTAAVEYLQSEGAIVAATDKNPPKVEGKAPFIETVSDEVLKAFDFVVVSPGIPPEDQTLQCAEKMGLEIIGETELALREIKRPVLGITGTNGKTTVTELVTHVLNISGRAARAVGNHGYPLTQWLVEHKDKEEVLVLELSSYQLETMSTKCLDAAVILNITPDHLDRYKEMEAYAKAKWKIQEALKPNAPLFVYEEAMREFGYLRKIDKIITFSSEGFLKIPDKKEYAGKHDKENIVAAYLLVKELGVTSQEFLEALETFKKPSHRIEYVCTVRGVDYYDDSKGTNIDAVIRAVDCFKSPIHLIAGGVDKGFSYTPWLNSFAGKVKTIAVIGEAADKIAKEVGGEFLVTKCQTLEEAVQFAAARAEEGEVVLLSPGCSSFDMFKNYKDRGEKFQLAVRGLG